MLIVNHKIHAPCEKVLAVLGDSATVVAQERLATEKGVPKLHYNLKGDNLKMFCEMTGRPTRDRDFRYGGTRFVGRITERDGVTAIRGVIWTAPLCHFAMIVLFAYFIYRCISLGGISVVPLCILTFDIFMFLDEFKKQGIIKRYIFRALKIVYRDSHSAGK